MCGRWRLPTRPARPAGDACLTVLAAGRGGAGGGATSGRAGSDRTGGHAPFAAPTPPRVRRNDRRAKADGNGDGNANRREHPRLHLSSFETLWTCSQRDA